jgi:hypothetical protein
LRFLGAAKQTEVPLIDLNNLRMVKLVTMIELSHHIEEVFYTCLKKKIVVKKFVAWIGFFEFVQFFWVSSDIGHYDLMKRNRRLGYCIVVEAVLTHPQVTFHAEVRDYWRMWVHLFEVHLRQALKLKLRPLTLPSKFNGPTLYHRMLMNFMLERIELEVFNILGYLNPSFLGPLPVSNNFPLNFLLIFTPYIASQGQHKEVFFLDQAEIMQSNFFPLGLVPLWVDNVRLFHSDGLYDLESVQKIKLEIFIIQFNLFNIELVTLLPEILRYETFLDQLLQDFTLP